MKNINFTLVMVVSVLLLGCQGYLTRKSTESLMATPEYNLAI